MIPKTWENMYVVFDTIEDAPATWAYAAHLRRVIYEQNGRVWDPNAARADQLWVTILDEIFRRWSQVSNYL